jgi:hypothetical protein
MLYIRHSITGSNFSGGRRGRDRMVVGYTTTCENLQTEILVWFGVWCVLPLSTILQYIAAAGFTGGGNRNT